MPKLHPWVESVRLLGKMEGDAIYSLFERQREARVVSDVLQIGNTEHDFSGRTVSINLKEGKNEGSPRIFVVAPTSVGKSTLMATILYQAYISGITPVVLFDKHNEYKDKLREASSFFNDSIDEAVVQATPYFIYKSNPMLRAELSRCELFQFRMEDLSRDELHTLFDVGGRTDIMKQICLDMMLRALPSEKFNLENTRDMLWGRNPRLGGLLASVSPQTKASIGSRIENIFANEVLGERVINIPKFILSNQILDFCFKGSRKFLADTQAYISIIQKILFGFLSEQVSKRDNVRIMTCYDEVSVVAPKHGDPSCKEQILSDVQESRKFGESMIYSTQEMDLVDDFLVSQSKFLLVSPMTKKENIEKILDMINMDRSTRYWILEDVMPMVMMRYKTDALKPWVLIERSGRIQPLYPYVRV